MGICTVPFFIIRLLLSLSEACLCSLSFLDGDDLVILPFDSLGHGGMFASAVEVGSANLCNVIIFLRELPLSLGWCAQLVVAKRA